MKKKPSVFSAEERAAMKEMARERSTVTGVADVLAKIAEMSPADRAIAEKLHAAITKQVPALAPRTWYGMPAYAKDGNVVCFFQAASKFKSRYATFGFSDKAKLDAGAMWPTSFALSKPTAADLAKLIDLVKRATAD